MTIPKVVHYCWFGESVIPSAIKQQIEQWHKMLPNYTIVKWDESKFDLNDAPLYVQQAYKSKKYAFVTDYVRLFALYRDGGIYLDTDVEVIKPFDQLLEQEMFIGLESVGHLCTAVIGAKENNPLIYEMMNHYNDLRFENCGKYNLTPNSKLLFEFLEKRNSIKYSEKIQRFSDFTCYPRLFFSPKNFYTGKIKITDETYTIHKFESSWKKRSIKNKIASIIVSIFGENFYSKIVKIIKKGRIS